AAYLWNPEHLCGEPGAMWAPDQAKEAPFGAWTFAPCALAGGNLMSHRAVRLPRESMNVVAVDAGVPQLRGSRSTSEPIKSVDLRLATLVIQQPCVPRPVSESSAVDPDQVFDQRIVGRLAVLDCINDRLCQVGVRVMGEKKASLVGQGGRGGPPPDL